jgi:4-amino-4-deoxy-L-arabinose transferase-like glycosyltransferase
MLDRIGHRVRGSARSRFARRLALIAAVGLALRLVYILLLSHDLRGTGDSDYFYVLGGLIARGHGFSDSLVYQLSGALVPTALHPPLFPLILAAAAKLGLGSYLAQRVVVALLGTGTIVLVGLLGRRAGGSERVGLIAAAMAAAYPTLIAADGAVMSETLFGLLLAWSLLAAYRLRERPGVGRAALLGAAIALTSLARAEALLLLPLVALPVALRPRDGALRRVLAAGAACFVLIAPWTVRNWVVFDRFVPISNNSGTLIAGANCDRTYSGDEVGRWVIECVAGAPGGGPLGNEAVSAAEFRRHGLHYAGDHLSRLPLVEVVRLLRTASLYQPAWQARHAEARQEGMTIAGLACFYLLLPIAAAGAVRLRRRGEPLFILAAPVVLAIAITLVGYGELRFRHGAELTLVVLASIAVDGFLRRRAGQATGARGAGSATVPRGVA